MAWLPFRLRAQDTASIASEFGGVRLGHSPASVFPSWQLFHHVHNWKLRYLPHLFTEWWVSILGERIPRWNCTWVPLAFRSLSESESPSNISNYRSRRPLGEEINLAAQLLWSSSLNDTINLMLISFHNRPPARNNLQHPAGHCLFICWLLSWLKTKSKNSCRKTLLVLENDPMVHLYLITARPSCHCPTPSPCPTCLCPRACFTCYGYKTGTWWWSWWCGCDSEETKKRRVVSN